MSWIFKDLDVFYNDFELSWEDACERLLHYLRSGLSPFSPQYGYIYDESNYWLVMFYGKSLDDYLIR